MGDLSFKNVSCKSMELHIYSNVKYVYIYIYIYQNSIFSNIFKNQGKINIFLDLQKLNKFISSHPATKEVLKSFSQRERIPGRDTDHTKEWNEECWKRSSIHSFILT